MATKSKSEVGHAKNVANLEDLIADLKGLGPVYNPPRAELQLDNLQRLHREAQEVLRLVAEKEVLEQGATNERSQTFKLLRPKVTSILNTMVACGLSEKTIADARAIQRRINGTRAGKKSTTNETPTTAVSTEETALESEGNSVAKATKTISASRQSFDLLIEHFTKLRLLLQREPLYTPNEEEMQLAGLEQYEQYLRSLISNATNAESESAAARMQRSKVLYDPNNGLVALALQTKSYIKALFGSTSPQYRRISKLSFRFIK